MQHKVRKTPEQVVLIAREVVAYAHSLGCLDIEFNPDERWQVLSIVCIANFGDHNVLNYSHKL